MTIFIADTGEGLFNKIRDVISKTVLTIGGTPLEARSVSLDKGWNWVPYLSESPLPVEEAMASIREELVMVKNQPGDAYIPDQGVHQLQMLKPGEGYRIYVNEATTLTYPDK